MKKAMALSLPAVLCISMVGCGKTASDRPVQSSSNVYSGILEEKKDFIIVVSANKGQDAVLFNLQERNNTEA